MPESPGSEGLEGLAGPPGVHRGAGPLPGAGITLVRGRMEAAPEGDIHFLLPRPQRAHFVVMGCGMNPGLPGSLPWHWDTWDRCQQAPMQLHPCPSGHTVLCLVYPRQTGAIPGDLLSLSTALALAWSSS